MPVKEAESGYHSPCQGHSGKEAGADGSQARLAPLLNRADTRYMDNSGEANGPRGSWAIRQAAAAGTAKEERNTAGFG